MDFTEGSLVCKAKSVVSTLFGIMLWTSTSPSPIRFPKEGSTYPGLKILEQNSSKGHQNLLTPPCYHILHSYMIPWPAPSSPSGTTSPPLVRSLADSSSYSSCSSALDDLIGAESGACMNPDIEEEIIARREKLESYDHYQGKRKQRFATRKKYPPPIPLLARTGNLPGHMPWILSRHYIDGRLVLIEERVRHHEYFEAQRENGRLLLNLVPLDDNATSPHFVSKNEDQERELQDVESFEEEKETKRNVSDHEEGLGREAYQEIDKVAGDECAGDYLENSDHNQAVDDEKLVTTSNSLPKSSLKNGSKKTGDLRKCFTYAGRMISDINLPCTAINAHRNAAECMNIIHSGSAPLDLGNFRHPLTTAV